MVKQIMNQIKDILFRQEFFLQVVLVNIFKNVSWYSGSQYVAFPFLSRSVSSPIGLFSWATSYLHL